jgi:hypothetical protein
MRISPACVLPHTSTAKIAASVCLKNTCIAGHPGKNPWQSLTAAYAIPEERAHTIVQTKGFETSNCEAHHASVAARPEFPNAREFRPRKSAQ